MKFSCTAAPTDISRIETLRRLGYDGFELHFALLNGMTAEAVSDLAKKLTELDFHCVSANGMFPGDFKLLGGSAEYPRISGFLEDCFAKAAVIGVPIVVLGSGSARQIPDGMSRAEAEDRFCALVSDVIMPIADKYGITVALEELNAAECNFINSCREAMKLISRIDHPDFRLLVDFFHTMRAGETFEDVASFGKNIAHVHFASIVNERKFPCADDADDLRRLFGALRTAGYDGAVSVEAVPFGDFEKSAADALDIMRRTAEQ